MENPQERGAGSVYEKAARQASLRKGLYVFSFFLCFLAYTFLNIIDQGVLLIGFACILSMGLSAHFWPLGKPEAWRMSLVQMSVFAAMVLSLFVPILIQTLGGQKTLAENIQTYFIWPQLLLTLLAHRIFFEQTRLVYFHSLANPLEAMGVAQAQSFHSALALGSFFTLVFYLLIPITSMHPADPTLAMILSACTGKTIIHYAIIFFFFVLVGMLTEAYVQYRQDCRTLRSFQQKVLQGASWEQACRSLEEDSDCLHGLALLKTDLDFLPSDYAVRVFFRKLIPLLPLLGFLGTVIGLAATMAELPKGLATGGTKVADFSGALAGLAIKFETTLLGLLASMICAFLLNLLEKRESDLRIKGKNMVAYLYQKDA